MISEAANIASYIPVDIILVLGIRGTHPMRGNDTMLVTTLLVAVTSHGPLIFLFVPKPIRTLLL
jgi:hypothetical protein